MSAVNWYVWDEGDSRGPLNLDELADMARAGRLSQSTDVRRETDIGWTSAIEALPSLFFLPSERQDASIQARHSWTDVSPHPWRRYLARMFDRLVIGTLTWALIGFVAFFIAPEQASAFFSLFEGPAGQLADAMLTGIAAIPGAALMIGLTGLSPGKWIFGVRVLRRGKPMGVGRALRRELAVLVKGVGLGIPLISLFTLIGSYRQLDDKRTTSWDRAQDLTVVHRPKGGAATVLMWATTIAAALYMVLLQIINR